MATRAAYSAFVRTYGDPEGEQTRGQFVAQREIYKMRWGYYMNSAFDDYALWSAYKAQYKLYRHTRSLYNPARRLVDFYAGIVYPGTLTDDARKLPEGTPVAIPFAAETPPALTTAVAQAWQWSNWQLNMALLVRYGASLGDAFAHVVDDVDSGKVYMDILWPGLIRDIDLDTRGNVQAYTIEYDYMDAAEKYTYTRIVDREAITTLRDGKPYAYDDVPARTANPYGFVPAVWCKHTDLGGDHGEPAMRNIGKWDQLNSMASMAHDQVRKILTAPILLSGTGIKALAAAQTKRAPTADLTTADVDMEGINILQGSADAQAQALQLEQGEALTYIDSLLEEIERDHPELGMYTQLRGMSTVTGPGASRLFGDVESYVNSARAGYDMQSVKLFQMAVAIGGFRANRGDWGAVLSRQQEAFKPFNLASYAAGDLNLNILPRPLITPTPDEQIRAEESRLNLETQRQAASGERLTGAVNGDRGVGNDGEDDNATQ